MIDLNRLPEISEQALDGLKADGKLKHRILVAAANSETPSSPTLKSRRSLIALLALSAVLVLSVVGIGQLSSRDQVSPAEMHVIPAGNHKNASPVHLQTVIDEVIENKEMTTDETATPEPLNDESGL